MQRSYNYSGNLYKGASLGARATNNNKVRNHLDYFTYHMSYQQQLGD